MEETGIKRVAEWPYQCEEKGDGQAEPESAQGNDPYYKKYEGRVQQTSQKVVNRWTIETANL